MRIGIIGAGQIGGTLARRFTAAGHEVSIANSRRPETLAALSSETGAKAVTPEQAARAGEVVIVTIPMKNIPQLARVFEGVPDDVVVVDTGNYYPQQRDGLIDGIENGSTESRWVANQLGRPVVKAFNNIYAKHLLERGKRKGTPGRIALPVAGDDRRAKDVVIRLLDDIGFDGVDSGGLDESWRQQPGTPVYGSDRDAEGVRRGLKEARQERSPAFRAKQGNPERASSRA
ncbi:MAG TPA: NAD(P)-binding domain-containing protein [Gemmatimonadales bacterium]|nr:NAD(P)-binding domain-containing protein [Gemmatimonadales bacterium]